jgi:hypothetical protein
LPKQRPPFKQMLKGQLLVLISQSAPEAYNTLLFYQIESLKNGSSLILSSSIARSHLVQKNFKFHAQIKKCHFGNFSERAGMAMP